MNWQDRLKEIVIMLKPEGNISKEASSVTPELVSYIRYVM